MSWSKAISLLYLIDNSARVMRLRAFGTKVGRGTRIGRGTTIRRGVVIGNRCSIGELCVFEGQTAIGDGTCINAQCHVTRFSRIGNNVFIAPFFLSTNDRRMTYHRIDHGKNLSGVTIEDKVRIAGHVMTLPGVRIGEGAVVGAYSLVTRDVEPYTLVYGIPAKKQADGHRLVEEDVDPRFMVNERSNPRRHGAEHA